MKMKRHNTNTSPMPDALKFNRQPVSKLSFRLYPKHDTQDAQPMKSQTC
jgi:hypothetical protein